MNETRVVGWKRPCDMCGGPVFVGQRITGKGDTFMHEDASDCDNSLEMWIPGDYYKFVNGKRVHATDRDAEGIFIAEGKWLTMAEYNNPTGRTT